MKQGVKSTPKLFKKTQTFSLSNLHKQKQHLPSRYVHQKFPNKNQLINILNSIQTNVKTSQIQRIKYPHSPLKLKFKQKLPELVKKQSSDFKPRPLKRQESDFQQFKQIFINPIKQNLDSLQQTKVKTQTKPGRQINKQYDKLLQLQQGLKKSDITDELAELDEGEVREHYQQAIRLLQEQSFGELKVQQDFYEQQIRIQPPDFPNSSVASTLSPGSGYAPSIPLTSNISKQTNLRQLLIRAKAGMNTEDVQKQAHLSFYLGMIYEEQRNYVNALRFYRRFLGFAKGMQDKIGIALGANRVAINYFYNQDIKKSIVFHNENLKLSDNQNCFAGFYNLGICHRKINQFEQALEYFETALQWASQNGQAQSQCITFGQIAVTYKSMELYQKSLQNFEKSLQYCHRLKKTKLQQKNLMSILLIASQQKLYSSDRILQLSSEGYQCSKLLGDKRRQETFGVNLGIIKGRQQFQEFIDNLSFTTDIEEL